MPRRRAPEKPKRRPPNTGGVAWVERRQRWRARLPNKAGESWHLTRDEAEAWIARELTRTPTSFDPSETVGAYLDYWRGLNEGRWAPQTALRYKAEAATLSGIRATALWRLRGDQVMAEQARLLKRDLTRRYVYNVLSLLKRALGDAVKWKILPENVVETVTLPDPEHTTTQAWSLEEVRAVLSAIVGHRFEALYLLILWGGLRIGEAVALRWNQIADDGTVAFTHAEHTQLRGRPIGRTKRERDRETHLPAVVIARLRGLQAAGPVPVDWPPMKHLPVAYVYVSQRPDGNRWTPHTIRLHWAQLVAETKVTPLNPHGGRKSWGTMHMVSGTALADLSSLMGHSTPAVTAQSYIASHRDRRKESAERLAELILPRPKTDQQAE